MSQEFESDFDDIGRTRSGKKYKVAFSSPIFEDSSNSIRQQSPSTTEEPEGGIPYHPYTPQKQTGTQNNPVGTPSSSSQSVPTPVTAPSRTPLSGSTPVSQNPPQRNRMGDDMKLPIFKGTGAEDPEQHWFLCEAMWTIKTINDDNLKLVQLVTTLRDRALTWYIKYTTLPRSRTP